MAVVTVVAAGNMGRVFSGRCQTVVAGTAGTQNLCVINSVSGNPNITVVAILTDIRCLYVCQVLAGRFNAVVATGAIPGNTHVIEVRRAPGDARVTIVTGIAAGDMRWMFASCDDAVVTRIARTDDLCVIDGEGRGKNVRVVAVLANIAGLNVSDVLARRIDAVVAVNTIARDIQVIEVCRQPTRR